MIGIYERKRCAYMYALRIRATLDAKGVATVQLWGVCAGGIRGAAHKIVVGLVACGPAAASGAARDPAPKSAGLLSVYVSRAASRGTSVERGVVKRATVVKHL